MCNDAAQDAIEMFAFYHMEKEKLHPLSNRWFQDIKIIILTLTDLKKQKWVNQQISVLKTVSLVLWMISSSEV